MRNTNLAPVITPCTLVLAIVKTLIQPEIYGFKLKLVLNWRAIYIEHIRVASLMAGLIMREFLNGRL